MGICGRPYVYCLCLAGRVSFSIRAPVQSLTTAHQQRSHTHILSPSSTYSTPATKSWRGLLIYLIFNSVPIYYANHLFVNIYAFIQSDIVRVVLLLLLLSTTDQRHFTYKTWA